MNGANIKDVVKEKYGQAALRVNSGGSACCGAAPAGGSGCNPITSNIYDASQTDQIPAEAMLASLGGQESNRRAVKPSGSKDKACCGPACCCS
jgi:arsenite methyltransferase